MMTEIIRSTDLFVMQVEMDLYTLTKKVCSSISCYGDVVAMVM